MRTELFFQAPRRRALLAAAVLAGSVLTVPDLAVAEGLFDMFFGGSRQPATTPSTATE